MSGTMKLSELLGSLPQVGTNVLIGSLSNELVKVTQRGAANIAFMTVSNSEDLDNPTTRGVFFVNENTTITRPTKGKGWKFGYVINLAMTTGVQVWINFEGYIAVRGKGSANGEWTEWSVMQAMA